MADFPVKCRTRLKWVKLVLLLYMLQYCRILSKSPREIDFIDELSTLFNVHTADQSEAESVT